MAFYYKEIPPDLVSEEIRPNVAVALDFCRKDLKLPDELCIQLIRVVSKVNYEIFKWLDRYKKSSAEFHGSMTASTLSPNKNRILIRAYIRADEISSVIAYERQHIADRDLNGEYAVTGHLSAREHSNHASEIRPMPKLPRSSPRSRIGLRRCSC